MFLQLFLLGFLWMWTNSFSYCGPSFGFLSGPRLCQIPRRSHGPCFPYLSLVIALSAKKKVNFSSSSPNLNLNPNCLPFNWTLWFSVCLITPCVTKGERTSPRQNLCKIMVREKFFCLFVCLFLTNKWPSTSFLFYQDTFRLPFQSGTRMLY